VQDGTGVAWSHADGKGFNVQLECTPVDGRVSLRVTSEPAAEAAE
jgi:hypothetical protein